MDSPLEELAACCGDTNIIVTGKTAQFARLLASCKQARLRLPTTTPAGRDAVQALLANLHFTDLVDALEVLFVERAKVEQVLRRCSPLESIDDVEVIEQYIVGLQHTNAMAKDEIARLTLDRQSQSNTGHDDTAPDCLVDMVDQSVETINNSVELDKSAALNERLIKELKTVKESLKVEQERQNEQLSTLKKELHAVNQKSALLKDELSKCERREEDRLEEIRYLKGELERTQLRVDNQEAEIREPLEEQINDLSSQLAESSKEINIYKQESDSLRGQLKECELKMDSFKDTIDSLTQELESMKMAASNTANYDREIESLKKTNKAALDELAQVREQLATAKRSAISQEYLRNVIISFLCTPSQRPHMLQVLSQLLQMTPDEVSRVNI